MNTDRTIPFEDMALPGDVQPATPGQCSRTYAKEFRVPFHAVMYWDCDECGLEHREVMGDETK